MKIEFNEDELSLVLDSIIEAPQSLYDKWGEKFVEETHERLLQIFQEKFGM